MLKIEDVEEFHKAFGHHVKQSSEYTSHFDPQYSKSLHDDGLDYPLPEFSNNPNFRLRALHTKLVVEEAEELQQACDNEDATLYADALFDLLYVTYGAIIALGVPREIGDIVHRSNMSKGVRCEQCHGTGKYGYVHGKGQPLVDCDKCHGTGIVPILREDGKILKGPNWIDDKPLIAQCIEQHTNEEK